MTDWLMVIITAIYVVATIFICIFNGKSAKAAKEQTKEMIDQYNATNRPIVTIRLDIIRSGLLCFIIENEGPLPAKDVCVHINEAFIENINGSHNKSRINEMNKSSFYLASRQKVTILLGGKDAFTRIAKETARIDIKYNDKYNEHNEHTEIDLNQYRFLLVDRSSLEDISQHLKEIKIV